MRKYRLIGVLGALTLLAVACQSAPTAAGLLDRPTAEAPAPTQGAEALAPTSPPAAPVEQAPAAPVEQAPAAPVEVRQGLAATDPATVNLASGSPKLVEFFAFW